MADIFILVMTGFFPHLIIERLPCILLRLPMKMAEKRQDCFNLTIKITLFHYLSLLDIV